MMESSCVFTKVVDHDNAWTRRWITFTRDYGTFRVIVVIRSLLRLEHKFHRLISERVLFPICEIVVFLRLN